MDNLNTEKLSALIAQVTSVNPHLADCWQATAIIESLGYTDRSVRTEFGFPDALALGRYVYSCYGATTPPPQVPAKPAHTTFDEEIKIFIREFSKSFVFAFPLLVVLLLEYLPLAKSPNHFPPSLTSLLTLATITSLMTSGGFVQMISRQGMIYTQLNEPGIARQACLSLFKLGINTSVVLGLLGLWFGFYRSLFADQYLIIASIYYLVLSTLWMLFALLPIFVRSGAMFFLIGLTAVVSGLRLLLGIGALEAQAIAVCLTVGSITALIVFKLRQSAKTKTTQSTAFELPRLSALVYMLSPFFCYGVLYFGFIFADRIVAGSAINPATGLIFAIDSVYQQHMDLALLSFLLLVPLVEYLSYRFIRYWYQHAQSITRSRLQQFSQQLYHHYVLAISIILLVFLFISVITVGLLHPDHWSGFEKLESFGGSCGYLLFSIGLFNTITLFSLSQVINVLKALIPAFISNLLIGYLLAHSLGVSYAVIGLLIGAGLFALLSGRAIFQAIQQPDYVYYIGGY